jgi:hypothetical protein
MVGTASRLMEAMTMRVSQWIAATAIVALAAPLILAHQALALGTPGGCCVCNGCPSTQTMCVSNAGPPVSFGCFARCRNIGCTSGTRFDQNCLGLAQCPFPAPTSNLPMTAALAAVLASIGLYQLLRRARPGTVRTVTLCATILATAVAIYAVAQLVGAGMWQSNLQAPNADSGAMSQQHWTVDATRSDDGSVHGRVTVTGSPLISSGTLDGQISGDQLSGTIRDDAGPLVATVTGTVTGGVINGQYETPDGEFGSFTWH